MSDNWNEDFLHIRNALINECGGLGISDRKIKCMVEIACLTSLRTTRHIRGAILEALDSGCVPQEIMEVIYQAAPYIGYPWAEDAAETACNLFDSLNLNPGKDVTSAPCNNPDDRKSRCFQTEYELFGKEAVDRAFAVYPDGSRKVVEVLSVHCFGDYLTRSNLRREIRELIVFTVLLSLGIDQAGLKAHVRANLSLGNTRSLLLQTIMTCLPYIGDPKVMQGIHAVDEVAEQSGKKCQSPHVQFSEMLRLSSCASELMMVMRSSPLPSKVQMFSFSK